MATAICGGSKSYLIRQNVTILLKKYGYFGYLLQTKVTTAICGGSKSYLVRQNVTIIVEVRLFRLFASDKGDNDYMWRLEIFKCNYYSRRNTVILAVCFGQK